LNLYSDTIKSSTNTRVRTLGVTYLTELFDGNFRIEEQEIGNDVSRLSHTGPKSPELSIAWIKFSGIQMYMACLKTKDYQYPLQRWGLAIKDCLKDENVS
jgi:hypothetical protein